MTTTGKGPAGPGGGSSAPVDETIDGADEAVGGAAIGTALEEGPPPGERTDGDTHPSSPVGPTVIDPAAPTRSAEERLTSGPVMLGTIRRRVTLQLDGARGAGARGRHDPRRAARRGHAGAGRHPHAVLGAEHGPDQRVPGLRGRGRGLAGARAVVRTQVPRTAWRCAPTPRRSATAGGWCSSCSRRRWTCTAGERGRPALDARVRASTPRATARPRPRPPPASATVATPGTTTPPTGPLRPTVQQPVKIDNELYVRDYSRCIMCYKCVNACGTDAQFTFAIAAAGRGFDARIATEFDVELPDSACVYCGNCIGVCPTGALEVGARARAARGRRVASARRRPSRRRSARSAGSAATSSCTSSRTRSST